MSIQVTEIKIQLREELNSIMMKKGISQGEIGKRLGLDRRTINRALSSSFESTSINKLIEMIEAVEGKVIIEVKSN